MSDVTEELGVISIQGPQSRDILQKITLHDLSNDSMPPNTTILASIKINPIGKN